MISHKSRAFANKEWERAYQKRHEKKVITAHDLLPKRVTFGNKSSV